MESFLITLNKRGVIFVGLLAAVIVAASLVVWYLMPHEPSYQGRGLSAWLSDFEHDQLEKRGMAAQALRSIGPKAVPFIADRLRCPQSVLRRDARLRRWKEQFVEWLSEHSFIKVSPGRPADPRRQALAGLDALGPEAKDALPALEKLLNEDPPDPRALYVIARIGQAGLPLLTQSLTNSFSKEAKLLRLQARACLDMMKSNSETLYPKVEFGPDCSNFDRRICAFNTKVLAAAFQDYRAQHPEMVFPKGAANTPPASPPP
jgi:hypothetical protein